MSRRLLLLAGALALGLTATACDNVSPYALRVNGTTISRSDFEDEIKAILSNPDASSAMKDITGISPAAGAFDPASTGTSKDQTVSQSGDFVRSWLTVRVQTELIHEEFVRRKLTVDPAARANLEQQIDQSFSQKADGSPGPNRFRALPAKAQAALLEFASERAALTPAPTAAETRAAYDKDPTHYARLCLSHIQVADQAKAAALKTQLDAGADFATLAAANSADTGSNTQGGALAGPTGQCWTAKEITTQLPPEFAQAALAATNGKVTGPVQSQAGWHLISVRAATTFDQVQADVAAELQQAASTQLSTLLQAAVKKAHVSVSSRYGTWDAGKGVVVPPPGPVSATTSTTVAGPPTT